MIIAARTSRAPASCVAEADEAHAAGPPPPPMVKQRSVRCRICDRRKGYGQWVRKLDGKVLRKGGLCKACQLRVRKDDNGWRQVGDALRFVSRSESIVVLAVRIP